MSTEQQQQQQSLPQPAIPQGQPQFVACLKPVAIHPSHAKQCNSLQRSYSALITWCVAMLAMHCWITAQGRQERVGAACDSNLRCA